MKSKPLPLEARIRAYYRRLQKLLCENPAEYERLMAAMGPRRVGPLDPSDPIDRHVGAAWAHYEEAKARWIASGCDPERAPRLAWHFTRAGPERAEIRTTTGKLKKVRIQWAKMRENTPFYFPSPAPRPASPRRRRQPHKSGTAARGDPDGGDPDPERNCAVAGDDPRTAQVSRSTSRKAQRDGGRTIGTFGLSCNVAAPLRRRATCPA